MGDARDAVLEPLFRRHLRRPRLTGLLDAATAQAIIVTGPAGYGKTTLAREWLQGRPHVAWYHATPASADVGAFSAGLADTVGPLVPGAGERMRRRLRVGDATERLARPLAELLAEDLEPWPEGGIVVLDDYHLLAESKPVEEFLDWLLSLAPMRVLVTTRRRPGWATARRFLYGEAFEIGRDRLALTDEEAMQILEGRSTESVRSLLRRAEGWPALIGLASLSADLDAPEERVSESLFRYFAEEVLRAEPEDVQQFMLAASVPSGVTLRLAREVLGLEDPEPIVERLREADLLRETAPGAFRFHPLLREFLRRRLEESDPEGFLAGVRRIVDDARRAGRWEEAFELSRETGSVAEAAEIAGRAARGLLAAGQSETLEKWLGACGAAGVTIPGAALARAELLVRKGEMSAAAALAEDTSTRLDPDHPDYAWACNLTGRALHFTSQEEAAFERFQAGKRSAKTDQDLKEALWGLILVSIELAPETAVTVLREFEAASLDDLDARLRLAVGRSLAKEQSESIAGVWDQFEALLPSIQHGEDPLAASCFLAIGSAMSVMRGHYRRGAELADQALRMCRDLRLDFALGTCLAHRAAAEIGTRQFAKAESTLRSLRRSPIHQVDPFFHVEDLKLQARLLASRGQWDGALATSDELTPESAPARPYGVYLATIAMILAANDNAREAHRTAEEARKHGSNIEMYYCSRLADALAIGADGESAASRERLGRLIVQSARADYIDGIVFAYRLRPTILELADQPGPLRSIFRQALSCGRDYELARRFGIEPPLEAQDERMLALTAREREVLDLLLEGLTNAQIASRLYITRSTAKVHVRHIFAKLGVRTRLQAVIRAQELLDAKRR